MKWRFAVLWVFLMTPFAAASDCRQALVLGLDVSGSVDSVEYRLQLDGLAGALSHPDIRETLLMQGLPPVSLAVFEWSGPDDQRLLVDWRDIGSPAALHQVVTTLHRTQRGDYDPSTALGQAIRYGQALLQAKPNCWKRTLDISGDGYANTGVHPRDIGRLSSITINGLVVGNRGTGTAEYWHSELENLASYYQRYVTDGPDAFVEKAHDFKDFESTMVRKLKRELQGLSVSILSDAPAPTPAQLRRQ